MQAFDSLLAGAVAEYMSKSREIGSDVQTHVRVCFPPLAEHGLQHLKSSLLPSESDTCISLSPPLTGGSASDGALS